MIIKILKLFITFEHLLFFLKISQCSQVNSDFKIFGIIENSWEFP